MYIYNVTVKVEPHRAEEWLNWMQSEHIPEVLETGFFTENKICRVINEDDADDYTFAVQYTFNTMQDFKQYQNTKAQDLQNKHKLKFADDAFAFRTIMEIL